MRKILAWITSPPVIAIPVYVLISALSAEERSIPVEIWVLSVFFILTLTVLYIGASSRGLVRWLAPLQFIAQGIVISVLSIQFVLPYLSWVGILLTLIGLIVSGFMVFQRNTGKVENTSRITHYDIFESCPFPACVSDKKGSVISISDGLTKIIGKSREEVWQTNIEEILPPKEVLSFGDSLLRVLKMESKDRTWYSLKKEEPADKRELAGMLIRDSETEIFSKEYCKIRIEEEIVRIKRYKRWAVFMMVIINFINGDESINKKPALAFFSSFCSFLKNTLRNCDTVSRIDEFSVFIILPETLTEEPVNEVINRILNFSKELSNEINQLKCKISPSLSYIFYNASSGDISFEGILNNLANALSSYEYT